ncbi:DUF4153 domain-containing protein [Roseovarius sp. E0-M6]|uniref:DUF4153 domain-containing protein n=1 Tax=Roseovarius sp. E0-M6 TaxID=3127118 RepID=UPI00300FF3A1
MSSRPDESTMDRISLAAVGAVAGIAMYLLFDLIPELVDNQRLVLLAATTGASFFSVLLALLGPTPLRRAALAAATVSFPATLLFIWASFRYGDVEQFLERGHAIFALMVLLGVATPFMAAALEEDGGWKRYSRLFDNAWSIVVRYTAAVLFVAVLWAVLFLSDVLLSLVGVTIIDDIIDMDPMPWLVSGVGLGLGLAIVHELRDYISAFLFIQLLRVLLPLLLVVLTVFVVALPIQGLSGLFGNLSPAATLAAVTFAAITLISAVLHRDAEAESDGRFLRIAAQALAVLIVVPASLAVYAVSVRIGQYGLTPDRVAALVVCGVILVYAICYAGAVAVRADWTARIRRANLGVAVLIVALAALWLTPALNAERMSVTSQIARAQAGADIADLPIWEFHREWGLAGKRGLETLRDMEAHPRHGDLVAAVERAETATYRHQYEDQREGETLASLEGVVPIVPEGARLPEGALDALRPDERSRILEACQRSVPGGGPGCVMVVGQFDPRVDGAQAIGLFLHSGNYVRVTGFHFPQEGAARSTGVNGLAGRMKDQTIADIQAGRFTLEPIEIQVLDVDGFSLFPNN